MGLHVSLTQDLERKVHEKVQSGLFQNASEVVRDALRDYFERPSEKEVMAFAYSLVKESRAGGGYQEEHDLSDLKAIMDEEDQVEN